MPTLVLIDVQREYTTPGRPFHIEGIEASLENCERVLAHARNAGWQVIHVRHLQDGAVFNPETPYSRFVTGFEPQAGEHHVIKAALSCFSAPEFATLIADVSAEDEVYLVGYGSTMCVLATMADGVTRGRRLTLVHDASAARATSRHTSAQTHDVMVDVLALHGTLTTTSSVIA